MSSNSKNSQNSEPSPKGSNKKYKKDDQGEKVTPKKKVILKKEKLISEENTNSQIESSLPQRYFESPLPSTESSQHKQPSKRSRKSKKQRSRQNFLSRERKRNRKYVKSMIELRKLELQKEQVKFHNNCMETINSGVSKFTIKVKRRDIKAQAKDEDTLSSQMSLKKEDPKKEKISLLDSIPMSSSQVKNSEKPSSSNPFSLMKEINLPAEDPKKKATPSLTELNSDDYKLEEFPQKELEIKGKNRQAESKEGLKSSAKLVEAPTNEVQKIKILKKIGENKAISERMKDTVSESYLGFEETLKNLAKKHEFVVLKDFNKALSTICDLISLSAHTKMNSKKEIFQFCHQVYSKLTDKEEQKKISQTKDDLDKMGKLLTYAYYINNQNLKLAATKNRKKINQSLNRFVSSFLVEKSPHFMVILNQKGKSKLEEKIEDQ